jgi:D-3-phosphoglycerate dehydrogenase
MSRPRILVADPLDQAGLDLLAQAGEVEVRVGLSPAELRAAVRDVDALVVRSGVRVTAEVIAAAPRLKVIARAGVGVDNIDVEAATRQGIVVVNAPTGNLLAAAEHTLAMLLAAARNIPQADAAMRSGRWDRRHYIGRQVAGKTLGVVGFGRIGRAVAQRAKALGMRVIASDPYVAPEVMEAEGVRPVTLQELLREADFVTLHTDLRPETFHLIGEAELRLMKPTALLINCARGAVVDEAALVRALQEGWIAGAALDVLEDEQHPRPELLALKQVVLTPHLAASTEEAQAQVALDAAQQVIAILQGRPARWAVNAPALSPDAEAAVAPYLELGRALAAIAAAVGPSLFSRCTCAADAELSDDHLALLSRYLLAEYLQRTTGQRVNYVNAMLVARERGMQLALVRGPALQGYQRWLHVEFASPSERLTLAGALLGQAPPRVIELAGFTVDLVPRGHTLAVWHAEPGKPGVIGRLGTILGEYGISITGIEVGLQTVAGQGLLLVQVEQPLPEEVMAHLRALPGVVRTVVISFGETAA